MESVRRASGEELLEHQAFVRRLAHGLVRDAARADDLVQDAWVQALRHPPRVALAARTWFRRVVGHLASRSAREAGRRAEREAAAARPEAQPSALEIGERLAIEQRLVQAVEALREPYRSAIFLRYFEDLSPRAIAARDGVPVATVKTRLRRALELLREALDRPDGRRAWALALVRLARPEHASPPLLVPILAAGSVLAGATVWMLIPAPSGRAAPPALAAMAPARAPEPEPAEVVLTAPDPPREAARVVVAPQDPTERASGSRASPERASDPVAVAPVEPDLPRLRGRVLFPDSRGVPGARVVFGPFSTRTDTRGSFELVLDLQGNIGRPEFPWALDDLDGDTALVALYEGWVPAVRARAGALVQALLRDPRDPADPVDLVLESLALALSGTLLDRTGAPAGGWRIALLDGTTAYKGPFRPFSVEELASGASGHVETGADGGFAFRGLAEGKRYRVRAWNERTLEQVVSQPIPAGTAGIVLRASDEPLRPLVDGVVVGLDGSPLADVRCRLSMNEYRVDGGAWMTTGQEVRTDASGRFTFVDVPPAEVFIRFHGYGSGTQLELLPGEDYRNVRIELVRSGAFVFESSHPARRPGSVCVLDATGERLALEVWLGEGRSRTTRELELAPDGACRATVSELARWLVLHEGGRELARLPLTVRHGEDTLVRW